MRRIAIACILIVFAGCSTMPPLVPVRATVTLDGKALENVHVCFWSVEKGSDPSRTGYGLGITDASGLVVAKDLFGKEGLFPGKYKVTFSHFVTAQGKPISANAKPDEVYGGARDIMPLKYQKEATTDVVIDVPKAGLDTTFALSSK